MKNKFRKIMKKTNSPKKLAHLRFLSRIRGATIQDIFFFKGKKYLQDTHYKQFAVYKASLT